MLVVEIGGSAGKRRRKEEDLAMPLYMTQFAYTSEAWATLTDNPEDKTASVKEAGALSCSGLLSALIHPTTDLFNSG
jgi:hypothetical protein